MSAVAACSDFLEKLLMPAVSQMSLSSDSEVDESRQEKTDEDSSTQNSPVSNVVEKYIPPVDVPEKIVLVVDNNQDAEECDYLYTEDCASTPSPSLIRNEALRMYVLNKMSLNKDNEFAIVVKNRDKIKLVKCFTKDVEQIFEVISKMQYVIYKQDADHTDLTNIFKVVKEDVLPSKIEVSNIIPPEFIVHLILVYNSSYLLPKINESNEIYKALMSSPYFIFDILYLHSKPSGENRVQSIFNELASFVKVTSYLLESSRNVTKVFNCMAKLLPHPLQRVEQNVCS